MTVLLYERIELDESANGRYNLLKGCHITAYLLAALFGVLNCYFLFETMKLFDGRCVLDPHRLVFRESAPQTDRLVDVTTETVEVANLTAVNENTTATLMLDIPGSHFRLWSYCDLPLSTPLVAAVMALVWAAMFVTCPAGGRSKRGLVEPWQIVVPALIFSLVLLVFTGHNFHRTNSGLQAFCSEFYNVTNTTSCTRAMDEHVVAAPSPVSLTPSACVTLSRAASAGTFACWLVAAALLLARCVGAADFSVRRTRVTRPRPDKKSPPTSEVDVTTRAASFRQAPCDSSASEQDSLASEPTLSSQLHTATDLPLEGGLPRV